MAATKMSTPPRATAPAPLPPPLYPVSIRLQVGTFGGDSEYHLSMTEREIRSVFDGTAQWIRLPARFGSPSETRFIHIDNVMEFTLDQLVWPDETFIAEAHD